MARVIYSLLILLFGSSGAPAESLHVAVAANFQSTLKALAPQFEATHGRPLKISSGSSGVLYAQIINGAPYDVFLSADRRYPTRLEHEQRIIPSSRFSYANGILVLAYQAKHADLAAQGVSQLLSQSGLSTAIANPKLAPYGAAAQQVLARFNPDTRTLLSAANVNQALQMWHAGGADLALVAASQALPWFLMVPRSWYGELSQQGVILRSTDQGALARSFTQWLLAPTIQKQIARAGYEQVME